MVIFFSFFLSSSSPRIIFAFSISLEAIRRRWHAAERESPNFCDSCSWVSGEEVGFYPLAFSCSAFFLSLYSRAALRFGCIIDYLQNDLTVILHLLLHFTQFHVLRVTCGEKMDEMSSMAFAIS